MILLRGLEDVRSARGGILSIGNFDGVHRGHQQILSRLSSSARAAGGPAVVMTFDPHPIQLLAPDRAPPSLSTLRRKSELISGCGVDVLVVIPTTREWLALEPQQFFTEVICKGLDARGIVEGPNFFFGRDRNGTVDTLKTLCAPRGMSLEVVEPVHWQGVRISSSAVRKSVADGDLRRAVAMLGHPYQLEGEVVSGARRGREIGFPTANLSGVTTLLPPDGVYAATVPQGDQMVPAAVHLGPNPTFGEQSRKLEVHLIQFSGELYGTTMLVNLLDRVRGTQQFSGRDELVAQLRQDVIAVQECVHRHAVESP